MDAYADILNWIYNLRGGEIDLRLDRMNQALSLFEHPEQKFPSFHIAGTNGKGSTAAMLHRILTLAGYRTALYISPHLVSFTERIRVGDKEITSDEVVTLAEEVRQRIAGADLALTFFEFVTVIAFLYFARQQVEVAVVEVGLGGRLDATNLVKPVVSVITTIAKDHEAYLGFDVLSIAREKGGIIKHGVPVVCGALLPEVQALLYERALDQGSRPYFLGLDFSFFLKNRDLFDYTGIKQHFFQLSLALRGRHQRANASVALAALELAAETFPVGESAVREGLKSVAWPGRFEVMCEDPTVILDGAHNGEGVTALAEAINEFRQGRNVKLLFASMEDKDWRLMLDELTKVAGEVVLTRVDMPRSASPQQLAHYLAGNISFRTMEDSRSALQMLFNSAMPDDIILVAGSLYLLGEVRPVVQQLVSSRGVSPGNCA